jgi:hypothetical protein
MKVTVAPSNRRFETVGFTCNCVVPAAKATVPTPDIVPASVLLGPSNSSVPVVTETVPLFVTLAKIRLMPVPPVFSNVPPFWKVAIPDGLRAIPAASVRRSNVPLSTIVAAAPAKWPIFIAALRLALLPLLTNQCNPPPKVSDAPEGIRVTPSVAKLLGPSIEPLASVAPCKTVNG